MRFLRPRLFGLKFLRLKPGYQNYLPAPVTQNKASVIVRTLEVPTIVLLAGLAT
jgi:hypothetical protein